MHLPEWIQYRTVASQEFSMGRVLAGDWWRSLPKATPTQNKWGDITKKLKTYGYNVRSLWHTKCSIIFSMPKAWCTSAIITRTLSTNSNSRYRSIWSIRKCLLVWANSEKNLKYRMTDVGVWGLRPQPP